MKNVTKVWLFLLLMVFGGQASALTNAYFDNNSDTTVYIKFTLLYPVDEFKCKFAFSTAEDNSHNMVLSPYLHPVFGPFPGECHIAISASLDNKHFAMCKKGEDVVEGYNAYINVKSSVVSCEIEAWNTKK
jgi:hypothetical protein